MRADRPVRLLDVILGQISGTKWEARYHGRLGQPPIHPRVLAGVLLYGLLRRIRSSRVLEERGIDLYSPITIPELTTNPAVRDDPTEPVPEEQRDQLPRKNVTVKKEKRQQLDKAAFIYDEDRHCYWCPQGLALEYERTTNEVRNGVRRSRDYYKADAQACTDCPLRERCLLGKGRQRRISREPHERLRQAHARKMATPEAKQKYARRRHPGERPFAVIKHHFGARRFLLRGSDRVRTEWDWLAAAFNLERLMNLIQSRAGPGTPIAVVL